MSFRIARVSGAEDLPLPSYMTEGAAGMDLRAHISGELHIPPGGTVSVPTGMIIALPEGFEGQVRSRSGLAYRHGVTVLQGIGTIDSDYRGELNVLLYNHGTDDFIIRRGDRVAQLVVSRYERVSWDTRAAIDHGETRRGSGGYGSTGV